jgi:ketosteroid isomerase-like protein
MNNQAADSLAAWYRQDATLLSIWPDGRRQRGWDEEAAAIDGLFDAVSTLNLVVQDPTVEVLGHDVAVVTFRYSMDQMFRTEGRDIFSGRGTQVWVRERDGPGWVIGTNHLSRNPAPTERAPRP